MVKLGLGILGACLMAGALCARPATPDEDRALGQTIDKFVSGMSTGDARAIADATIIPRVLAAQAAALHVDEDALYSTFLGNLGEFLANITIKNIDFEKADIDIEDGTSNKWAWMDYHFSINVDGDDLDVSNRTLAIEEGSIWYLVRVDEQNLPVLINLFPEIAFENYGEAMISRADGN